MMLQDLEPGFVFKLLLFLSAFMAAVSLRCWWDERRKRRRQVKKWW